MAYRIYNWEAYYENAYARKINGALSWVKMPTAHDGKRFTRLSGHPENTRVFGAWCLILQTAAKCPTRGLLVDDRGDALTAEDMFHLTGFPAEDFELAFEVLTSPAIGWLESVGEDAKPKPTRKNRTATADPGDDLPSEADRLKAIESIERMLGRTFSSHEFQRFDTWADTVPESITLGGDDYDRYRLIIESAASAIEHMTSQPRGLGGATSYLTRIIDRCVNDGCKPGEFVEAKPKTRKSAAKASADTNISDPREVQI